MDRLLRYFLTTAIHHGSLSIVTARGSHFHCGDGSGVPLKVHFLTERAARRLVLDSSPLVSSGWTESC